jgi:hypothetical protein
MEEEPRKEKYEIEIEKRGEEVRGLVVEENVEKHDFGEGRTGEARGCMSALAG